MQSAPDSGNDEEEGGIFAEINITPLTDVFLVLLIIFMLIASSLAKLEKEAAKEECAISEKATAVETPKGSGDVPVVPKDIVVSILADGNLFVENEDVTPELLTTKLILLKSQAEAAQGLVRVVVRGDKSTQYQKVMDVITSARSAGISDVALASQPSR
ncbi:MAG TPA: biopolymer transporter ExbD [Myxococcota bacterium]|nr:biopolymer transporter ExbD [Myxococcota bacterium]